MTVHQISPAPVRKTQHVDLPPERAFDLFAAMTWWPGTHSIRRESPFAEAVLERRPGGRWYEKSVDGGTCEWGHVVAWEPPRRLVLAWQITAAWQFDPSLVTEVEITFVADAGGTLVTLEHRNMDRFGEGAEQVRAALDSDGGWTGLLALYAGKAG